MAQMESEPARNRWVHYFKPLGQPMSEFLAQSLQIDQPGFSRRLVDYAYGHEVAYLALETNQRHATATHRQVGAWICEIHHLKTNGEAPNVAIRLFSENDATLPQRHHKAPGRLLDTLTPAVTEPARRWRAMCAERLQRLEKGSSRRLNLGDILNAKSPLSFDDGRHRRLFVITGLDPSVWSSVRAVSVEDGIPVRLNGLLHHMDRVHPPEHPAVLPDQPLTVRDIQVGDQVIHLAITVQGNDQSPPPQVVARSRTHRVINQLVDGHNRRLMETLVRQSDDPDWELADRPQFP